MNLHQRRASIGLNKIWRCHTRCSTTRKENEILALVQRRLSLEQESRRHFHRHEIQQRSEFDRQCRVLTTKERSIEIHSKELKQRATSNINDERRRTSNGKDRSSKRIRSIDLFGLDDVFQKRKITRIRRHLKVQFDRVERRFHFDLSNRLRSFSSTKFNRMFLAR